MAIAMQHQRASGLARARRPAQQHRPHILTTLPRAPRTRGAGASARGGRCLPFAAAVDAPPAPPSPSPSSAAPEQADAAAPDAAGDLFDWAKCWYPAADVRSLQTDKPNALPLLGMNLVVWRDAAGTWRTFEDLCPHRLAPLSEGRIHESGQLQCTYHGWLFDQEGTRGVLTTVPQIPDAKAHATACGSARSCVKAFPTQVLHGLLWVYADASPAGWAAAEAAPVPPAAAPELLPGGGWEAKARWFQRDVPLSFDLLLENFLDPSHVPQSHSGVVGDRDADQRMTIAAEGPVGKGGFAVRVEPPAPNGRGEYRIEFAAPSLVRYGFPGTTMLLYGVPTAVGWSRVVMTFIGPEGSRVTRPPTPQLPPLLNFFIDNVIERSTALQHAVNRNAIIDGDTYFMHKSERVLYDRGDHASWGRQYYMPSSCDVAVAAWRRWIDRFGSALPTLPRPGGPQLPPLMPREVVMDRLGQHTKHCPECSAALRRTELAIGAAAVVGVVAAAVAVVAALAAAASASAPAAPAAAAAAAAPAIGAALGARAAAAGVAVAAIAGALVAALLRFRRLFIFTDYVHAEH